MGFVMWVAVGCVAFGALMALLLYVVAPIVTRCTFEAARRPRFEPAGDAAADALDQSTRDALAHASAGLVAAGFEALPVLRGVDIARAQSMYVWPFRRTGDPATAILYTSGTVVRKQTHWMIALDVVTAFTDGGALTTSTAWHASGFPTPPECVKVFLPDVRDPARVVALHDVALRERAADRHPRPGWLDDPAMRLAESGTRDLENAIERGVLAARGDRVVVSWRGAFQLTWQQLWPLASRRLAAARAEQTHLVGQLVPAVASAARDPRADRVVALEEKLLQKPIRVLSPHRLSGQLSVMRGMQVVTITGIGQAALALGAEAITFPGDVALRYDELEECTLIEEGPAAGILIRGTSGDDGAAVRAEIPVHTVLLPDTAEGIVETVRSRMRALVDGPARVEELDRAARRTYVHQFRRPVLTWALALATVACYVAQGTVASGDPTLSTLLLGSMVPTLVHAGEFHRLITANMLHWGGVHVGLVLLALLGAGVFMERVVGTSRFAVIYVLGAAAGYASLLAYSGGWQAYGGSSSIAAVAGALAVIGQYVPGGDVRQNRRLVIVAGVLTAGLFALEWFAMGAWLHAAAMLGGATVAACVVVPAGASGLAERPGPLMRLGGAAAVAVLVASASVVMWQAVLRPTDALAKTLDVLGRDVEPDCWSITDIAQRAVGLPDRALRAGALRATQRCIAEHGDEPEFQHRMTHVLDRLARPADAARAAWTTLVLADAAAQAEHDAHGHDHGDMTAHYGLEFVELVDTHGTILPDGPGPLVERTETGLRVGSSDGPWRLIVLVGTDPSAQWLVRVETTGAALAAPLIVPADVRAFRVVYAARAADSVSAVHTTALAAAAH